jgi:hypothetical protein
MPSPMPKAFFPEEVIIEHAANVCCNVNAENIIIGAIFMILYFMYQPKLFLLVAEEKCIL